MELGERTTDGCRNCGGVTDPAHPDMCCLCMCIAFGSEDHRAEHETPEHHERKNARRRETRAAKREAMESLGLVKVRGNLGGTYWE